MGEALDTTYSASSDAGEVTELTSLGLRIAAGDRQAEQLLVARLFPAVGLMCRRRFGNTADADDAQQQALEIVLRKLRAGGVSNVEAILGYLATTVQNLKSSAQRMQRKHPTDSLPDGEQLDHVAGSGHHESAERSTERAQVGDVMRNIMQDIPNPRDRVVLYRRYLLEQDKDEICGALGLDNRHFDRVIHRAKQRLRAVLRPFWTEQQP